MSSVNVTETVSKMVDHGADFDEALEDFRSLSLTIVDFDAEQSHIAARLRPATRHRGLSLGERACLALAIREGATALTADRKWADLDVGCKIELIR
jgi:PIN domain nuclease of toxin-antitoxin system